MKRKGMICLFFSTGLLTGVTPVLAQDAAPAQPQADAATVGEIIVTAQKRSESINNVGMAISALGGADLIKKGIADTGDLAKVVPGFVYTQSQKGAPVFSLRGVGFYEESLGASPAVSIYVDEVGYAFPITAKGASIDLQRVEVLKGPQGTLFGQNSTGGAVNYIAAKPTQDFTAGIYTSVNNFGRVQVGGHVSGGITNTLTVRLSGEATEGGAWQKSVSRGDRNGSADILKGRFLAEWKPSSTFKVSLNLNGFRDRSDSLAAALVAVTPQTPSRASAALLAQTPVPARPGLVEWSPQAKLRVDENFVQGALRIDAELMPALKLTSITSLSHFDLSDYRDTDGSVLNVFAVQQVGRINSFSQELRASGATADGRLQYVAGGFYANDRTWENNRSILPDSTSANPFVAITGAPFLGVEVPTNQKTLTKAVFGNVDFKLNSWISFHAGARHTWSSVDFSGCMKDIDGLFAPGANLILGRINPGASPAQAYSCVTVLPDKTVGSPYAASLDEQNTSWRAGLDLKPARGTLVYATISRGYKSGSFPNINATTYASFQPVKQESLTAYEVGLKSNLGTHIAHLDASVFYYSYRNKQFRGRIVDPLGVFGAVEALVNVPKSRVVGAEASLRVDPIPSLTLNTGVTFLDTKVTSSFDNYNPFGAPANFQGEAFPFTPKWTVQGGFEYHHAVTQRHEVFIGGNASYRSATSSAFGAVAPASLYPYSLLLVAPYALVDAQAGIRSSDGHWQATVFVNNLFNKYYWTDAFRQIDNVSRHIGEPRSFGLRFSHDF